MTDDIRQRLHELELIETEYLNLRRLLDIAAESHSLDQFSGEMVLYTDTATGRVLDANPLALLLLGYSAEEIRTLDIDDLEFTPPEVNTVPQRYFETSIETFVYECYYRQRDGRLTPVRTQKRLLTHNGVHMTHYSLKDRSLRGKLSEELTRREDADFQFREKLKILNEINAEMGVSETFDEVCRRAVLLGIERLGFERLSVWLFDPQTNRMHGTFGVDETGGLRDEREVNWPIGHSPIIDFVNGQRSPIITHDNAPIYNNRSEIIGYGWHASAPLLHEGVFIGYMTADNYLTRQPMKSYQPELLRTFAATVGHFSAHQRSREAARKLADAVRAKQERIQMLGTFITHISHDFRTPLTIINTNAYLLRKTQDDGRKEMIAGKIESQVEYIDRVIKQMLEVVKLEERVDFVLVPVQLDAIVNGAAQSIEGKAIEKGVVWSLAPVPALTILADPQWLARGIREVLLNAVQYTDAGGHVSVQTVVHDGNVEIQVSDTGLGIAPQEIGKIFQHLYRVDPARTLQGVGLGLTLAKLIIEAHGGHIAVNSTPNGGSTFVIVLPLGADGTQTPLKN